MTVALLDTCTLLWLVAQPDRLSQAARALLSARDTKLRVSALSAFEIGVKTARGRLELPESPAEWFRKALIRYNIRVASVTSAIALRAAALPPHHRDPVDRIIIASAQLAGYQVLTPDAAFRAYDVQLVW
jgi:PIN domain nuclease of toxin-antitoxin system